MSDFSRVNEAVEKLYKFLSSPFQRRSTKKTLTNSTHSNHASGFDGNDENQDDIAQLFSAPQANVSHSIELQLAFLSAPHAHRVPLYVKVPHPFMVGSICIITLPPQRSYKDKIMHLAENGNVLARQVKRVIDSTKLCAKVSEPVAVRAFAKSYDNFILYGLRKYPAQLTGEFIGHHKLPVWIAKKGTVESALQTAARTVVVPRRGQNAITCCVGNTNMKVNQVVDNIVAFLNKFTSHPQGAPKEHILHIRVSASHNKGKRVGLPIYGHEFIFSKPTKQSNANTTTLAAVDDNTTNVINSDAQLDIKAAE